MQLKEIGCLIREYRRKADKTQKEVGDAIGRSESVVGDYENGKIDIPASVLLKIAEALDVQPAKILGARDPEDDFKPDATLRIFTQEDRKTVAGILTMNGYTVRQVKIQRENKKSSWYCINAMLDDSNMGSQ